MVHWPPKFWCNDFVLLFSYDFRFYCLEPSGFVPCNFLFIRSLSRDSSGFSFIKYIGYCDFKRDHFELDWVESTHCSASKVWPVICYIFPYSGGRGRQNTIVRIFSRENLLRRFFFVRFVSQKMRRYSFVIISQKYLLVKRYFKISSRKLSFQIREYIFEIYYRESRREYIQRNKTTHFDRNILSWIRRENNFYRNGLSCYAVYFENNK